MAEPGRASRRRAQPHTATQHRRCGGRRRDRRAWPRCRWVAAGPGRASRSTTPSRRLACGDLAGGPPPTGTHSGRAPKQHNGAPETPAAPQATSSIANYGCTAGVKGARGPGRGARGRRQGLAAVPEGGGRARAGLEIDHSERSSRVAISRAGRRPPAHTAAGPHKAARDRCAA